MTGGGGHGHEGWCVPVNGVTDRHLLAAQEAVSRAGGFRAFELVVLGGSLVAGLGHGFSDLDLYVTPADGREVSTRRVTIDDVATQLNPVSSDSAAELAADFGEYRVSAADRGQLIRMVPHLKLLSRLAMGRVLHVGADFEPTWKRFDPDAVRRLFITHHARQVSRFTEDALGGLRTGDALIAIQSAETALRYGCETAMAACGDFFVGESFFWRRLTRADGSGTLARQAWRLLRGEPRWGADQAEVAAAVRRTVRLATDLAGYAQLDGWAHAMPAPPAGVGRHGARNPFFTIVRFGDTVALAGPGRGLRSNEATARLWLGARDAADLDDATAQRFGDMGLLDPGAGLLDEPG